ncbi:hypothetical protein EI94DRAFT_1698371 [Lactarius quietus]|nr:hypothetical protein EI94DRAFT_1698371 [Lactarius quietus]
MDLVKDLVQREKIWSRIRLPPLPLAEGDRDAYRREQAALARERAIMKDVKDWETQNHAEVPDREAHALMFGSIKWEIMKYDNLLRLLEAKFWSHREANSTAVSITSVYGMAFWAPLQYADIMYYEWDLYKICELQQLFRHACNYEACVFIKLHY